MFARVHSCLSIAPGCLCVYVCSAIPYKETFVLVHASLQIYALQFVFPSMPESLLCASFASNDQFAGMKRELQRLRKHTQRMRASDRSECPVPNKVQKTTAAVFALNQSLNWATCWAEMWRQSNCTRSLTAASALLSRQIVETWCQKWATDPHVRTIVANLNNPDRVRIDRFLIESIVFEYVLENNRKGISVPSAMVVAKYIRLWSYRPRQPCIDAHLKQIQDCPSARKNWCRRFRLRWGLKWGKMKQRRSLTNTILRQKVGLRTCNSCYPIMKPCSVLLCCT